MKRGNDKPKKEDKGHACNALPCRLRRAMGRAMLLRIFSFLLIGLIVVILLQSAAKVFTGRASLKQVLDENRRLITRLGLAYLLFAAVNVILQLTSS